MMISINAKPTLRPTKNIIDQNKLRINWAKKSTIANRLERCMEFHNRAKDAPIIK